MSDASGPPGRGGAPTRLLDAGEKLFSVSGYDAVTVRRITQMAGVPLGLLSYHFRSKEALFEAVIARRSVEIAAIETPSLARLAAGRYGVWDLVMNHVRAYTHFSVGGDEGWIAYFRLIAQLQETDRWLHLARKHFNGTAELYLDALHRLWPGRSRRSLASGWMHVTSVTCNHFARTGRVETFLSEAEPAADAELELRDLVTFTASGLTTMLDADGSRTAGV